MSDMISGEILTYYAEFNLFVNFIHDNLVQTCGVNITESGMNFYWNENFLNILSQSQVNFIFIHETFHLLFDHPERSSGYQKDISNIAQDMIINKIIFDDIVKTKNNLVIGFVEEPIINGENITIYPPIEYKGNLIFEELYWWLIKENEKYKNKDKVSDYLSEIFDKLENTNGEFLDKHLDDDINKEYRKQIIENIKENLKLRGFESNDVENSLNKLKKSNKDYLKEIKKSIVNYLFGEEKNKTIIKPNRKGIDGLKGNKKISNSINCILDTSASMNDKFDYVLSFIFQNNIKINLIQIDTKIKKIDIVKNMNDLKKLKIKGGGGTIISPSLKYISENKKLNKLNTIILTDGMTDILNFEGIKTKTLILTTLKIPKIINNRKRVKTIIVYN
jgi:predicted metal-dependent peptidase